MKFRDVSLARIYISEGSGVLERLIKRLHDEERVRGVTVLRGVEGFGPSGRIHSAHLVELASTLPLIVEFYDEPARVREVLARLGDIVEPGHIVVWPVQVID